MKMITTERVRPKNFDDAELTKVIQLIRSLISDFPGYTEKELELDMHQVQQRLSCEGLSFATLTLPNLGKGLLAYLETGTGIYSGFKTCKHGYPSIFKRIFRHVYDSGSANHIRAVRVIYQISELLKKLRGPFDQEKLKIQLTEFVSVDAALPEVKGDDVLHYARYLITKVFSKEEGKCLDIYPRPGPGATNTPVPPYLRFRPNIIFRRVDDIFPYGEYFYATFHEFCSDRARLQKLYKRVVSEQTARFKFVPKKVGTARGICIEENDVQYLQQGLARFVRSTIGKSDLCKNSIHFSEQDFNAQAALLSSVSGINATLDMKEASDRISRSLVTYLFSELPLLLDCLLALSTKYVDLSKALDDAKNASFGVISINKYAPMGSALCFPIMSVVHWALCTAVAKVKCNIDPHNLRLFVYGDDIVLPSSIAPEIMNSLPLYGLKFNESKSFWRGHFRESCGIHAYHGVNITPIYIKDLPLKGVDPNQMSGIIANEQLAYRKGLKLFASCIRSAYELPYVHDTSSVVGWKRPDKPFYDLRAPRRRDENLQRDVYRCRVFRALNEAQDYQQRPGVLQHLENDQIFLIKNRLPRKNLITVLTQKQIKALQMESNWPVNDAYLRALLLNTSNHDRYWAFSRLAYSHKWL